MNSSVHLCLKMEKVEGDSGEKAFANDNNMGYRSGGGRKDTMSNAATGEPLTSYDENDSCFCRSSFTDAGAAGWGTESRRTVLAVWNSWRYPRVQPVITWFTPTPAEWGVRCVHTQKLLGSTQGLSFCPWRYAGNTLVSATGEPFSC